VTNHLLLLALAAVVGYLAGTLLTLTAAGRRARRGLHPMQYDLPIPTGTTIHPGGFVLDWDTAMDRELNATIPLPPLEPPPVPAPGLESCVLCGKAFKRVAQHVRMSHKVPVALIDGGSDG
jgi:hypothetical protein